MLLLAVDTAVGRRWVAGGAEGGGGGSGRDSLIYPRKAQRKRRRTKLSQKSRVI